MERTRNRNLWVGLGLLALLLLFAMPLFGGGWMGGHAFDGYGARPFGYGGGPMPMMWGFWGIGLLFRALIFGGILFFLFSFFRRRSFHTHDQGYSGPELSSLEILRRRYAAGEITREQFEEMRRTLETSAST
jgi:putative membrane protein